MNTLTEAIKRAKRALSDENDSNDEEHVALFELVEAIEVTPKVNLHRTGTIRYPLIYQGKNPNKFSFAIGVNEDGDDYREPFVTVFRPDGTAAADIFITLDDDGGIRVLLSADGDGDNDHKIVVYPLRPALKAVEYDIIG